MTTIARISAAIASTVAALAPLPRSDRLPREVLHRRSIRVERDTEDASGMKPLEIDLMVDMATSSPRPGAAAPRAKNVNTIDESRTRAGSPTAPAITR
jgi:hypothetical protein